MTEKGDFKYRAVAKNILADFRGALAPGEKLPSLSELCQRYAVGANTIKKALGLLAESGIVRRTKKSGTSLLRHSGNIPLLSVKHHIRILALPSWRFTDVIEDLGRKFSTVDPRVSVTVERAAREDYRGRLAAGRYDLILANEWILREFLTSSELAAGILPLSRIRGLWARPEIFFPSVVKCFEIQGEMMGVPVNCSPVVSCVNAAYPVKNAADGMASSLRGGATLTEFVRLLEEARQPREGINSYPFLLFLFENRWPIIVRMLGGELFSPDGRECLLESRPVMDALSLLFDLLHRRRLCIPLGGIRMIDAAGTKDIFSIGKFLCTWTSIRVLRDACPFPLRFAPLPRERRPVSHLGLEGILVSKSTRNPEAIRDFLNFLQGYEQMNLFAERSNGFPCVRGFAEDFAARREAEFPGFRVFLDSLEFAEPVVAAPRGEIIRRIQDGLTPLWLGVESVSDVCRRLNAEINRMLKE
jgi:ABC-type glycerol-3-phosphate transport system substrate-binding protein